MNKNLCPLCRQSMRIWALDWRRGVASVSERTMIRTAAVFRDECCHTDKDKYDALVAKLNALPLRTTWLSLAIWQEIERIKNLHGGRKPVGRTWLAWRGKWETFNAQRATSNVQPATQLEAA